MTPEEQIGFADLFLWIAEFLRSPLRGVSGYAALPRSAEEELEELCRRVGGVAVGLSGSHLARIEEVLVSVAGPETVRLFEGPTMCPTNETAYVRRDKGRILADLEGFYRAFGFRVSSQSAEKGDHIVSELEFVALLLIKAACLERPSLANADADAGADADADADADAGAAAAAGAGAYAGADPAREAADSTEALEVTRSALRSFAEDHLHEWLPLFCQRLAATTEHWGYRALAELLLVGWTQFAGRIGLPEDAGSGPPFGVHPDIDGTVPRGDGGEGDDAGTPYECGMEESWNQADEEFPV